MTRVLILADDPTDRDAASRLVRDAGEDLHAEAHPIGGNKEIEFGAYEIVVVYLNLAEPRMISLLGKVRRQHPKVRFVLVTSAGEQGVPLEVLDTSAIRFVSKADVNEKLTDAIRKIVGDLENEQRISQLNDHLQFSEIRFELSNDPSLVTPLVDLLRNGLLQSRQFDEAECRRIGIALQEAVDNALYHGNLELTAAMYDEDMDRYYDIATERREQEPWDKRRIHILVRRSPKEVTFVVRDEGSGFDPSSLPDPLDPENMIRLTGRGLLLIRNYMDVVVHNEKGNEITLTKYRSNGHAE